MGLRAPPPGRASDASLSTKLLSCGLTQQAARAWPPPRFPGSRESSGPLCHLFTNLGSRGKGQLLQRVAAQAECPPG